MQSNQDMIKKLQMLRKKLTNRIEAIDKDLHHKIEPVEKDFAEQVTQRENDEVLTEIDKEAQQTIYLIDAALSRVKNGNYGTCASCGLKIPDQRLTALPYVTTCISCAE